MNKKLIAQRIQESIEVKSRLMRSRSLISKIKEAAQATLRALQTGHKVILFGNGGSAADAQHIAAELAGRFYLDRASLPAIALTVNTSNLTAIANDYSFKKVFSKQLQGLGQEGDVAIGISTSGNSRNVIEALELARKKGLTTIGLTGRNGGKVMEVVDICLCVPSQDTPRIQEAHTLVGHIICEIVEKEVFEAADEG